MAQHSRKNFGNRRSKEKVIVASKGFSSMISSVFSIAVVACIVYCWFAQQGVYTNNGRPHEVEQGNADPKRHQNQLQRLHATMSDAERGATGSLRSLNASRLWLETTLDVDAYLLAKGAPEDIRGYILSEIQRIALRHFPWNALVSEKVLLKKVAPALAERMLMHDEVRTCCSSDTCLHDQISTVMLLNELNMTDAASAHLESVKAAVISHGGDPSCRCMNWELGRLIAPCDNHFPQGYDNLANSTSGPAFWTSAQLPLAHHLEQHATEIVDELAGLCRENSDSGAPIHFGTERVVKNLAHGSWTSLPLLDKGAWNESACRNLAPRTCALLQDRAELQGALWSASEPNLIVQFTFVSIYRLRPQSHILRHVGTPWRVNTHLGLVTPLGARIRVWNESQEWAVGKALSFLDAADHEVVHNGDTDRCVLNVVSWHPAVMQRRLLDPSFADWFASNDTWSSYVEFREK